MVKKTSKSSLKAPSNNKCRDPSKRLVDPCEVSPGWKDFNRFSTKNQSKYKKPLKKGKL